MIEINAAITSIRELDAVRGDGELLLGENILDCRVPCMLKDPSSWRIAQEESRGIGVRHLLVVHPRSLRTRREEPERLVGARVEFYRYSVTRATQTEDIAAVRETSSGAIELTLGVRIDQAQIGGAS